MMHIIVKQVLCECPGILHIRVKLGLSCAGVVGLAVARALSLRGREVLVIEEAQSTGTGISSRNSEGVYQSVIVINMAELIQHSLYSEAYRYNDCML